MVCHCRSAEEHAERAVEQERSSNRSETEYLKRQIKELEAGLAAQVIDNTKFEIVDVEEVGAHLVVKVRYPSCTKCSYEGVKVMVYCDTTPIDALKWRSIDPHFKDPAEARAHNAAPSPAARFPASDAGWQDALKWAASL